MASRKNGKKSEETIDKLALTFEQQQKANELVEHLHEDERVDKLDFAFLATKKRGIYEISYNQVYGRRFYGWESDDRKLAVMFDALDDYILEHNYNDYDDQKASKLVDDFRVPVIICADNPRDNFSTMGELISCYTRDIASRGEFIATSLALFSEMESEFVIVTNMQFDKMINKIKKDCNNDLYRILSNAAVLVAAQRDDTLIANSPFRLTPHKIYEWRQELDYAAEYTGDLNDLPQAAKKAAECFEANIKGENIENALSRMFTFNDKTRKNIPEATQLLTFGNEIIETTKRDRRVSRDVLDFIQCRILKESIGINVDELNGIKNRFSDIGKIWNITFTACNITIKKAPYNSEIMKRLAACAEALETKCLVDALYKGVPYEDIMMMEMY